MRKIFKLLAFLASFGLVAFAGYMAGFSRAVSDMRTWDETNDETPETGDSAS